MKIVKEKLRKVLKKILIEDDIRLYCRKQEKRNEEGGYLCDDCPYCEKSGCMETLLADRLVQNGVTIATDTNDGDKWVSVDERLSEEESEEYNVVVYSKYVDVLGETRVHEYVTGAHYQKNAKMWRLESDCYINALLKPEDSDDGYFVTHWQELPRWTPKGVWKNE